MTVLEKLLQLAEINLWMFQYGLHTGLLFIFICNDYEIFILFHEWDSLCGSQKSRVTAEPTEPSQPPITKTSTAPGIVTSPGATVWPDVAEFRHCQREILGAYIVHLPVSTKGAVRLKVPRSLLFKVKFGVNASKDPLHLGAMIIHFFSFF